MKLTKLQLKVLHIVAKLESENDTKWANNHDLLVSPRIGNKLVQMGLLFHKNNHYNLSPKGREIATENGFIL